MARETAMTTPRRFIHALVVGALVASAGTAAALPPPLPAPNVGVNPQANLSESVMSVEGTYHDFGTVWDHKNVDHMFKFTNTGSEPLVIEDIRSTCGCTVPELEKKEYAPGESGEVKVIFNPHNRKGVNERTITVITNSKAQRVHQLSIKAEVKPVLFVSQEFIRLRTDKGDSTSSVLNIGGRSDGFQAKLKSVDTDGLIAVEPTATKTVEANGETWKQISFDVKSMEKAKVGMHRFTMTFETNDERRPEFTIQAVLEVKGDLEARPSRLALGQLEKDASFEKDIQIVSRKAVPFKITKVEPIGTLNDAMQFEWVPVDPEKRDAYRLIIKGTPTQELRQSGQLIVHTDMEDEPTIDIAYYGWVPRSGSAPTPTPPQRNLVGNRP